MLFITNRVLRQSSLTRQGRNVDFELRDSNALQSLFFCERQGTDQYVELGSDNFLHRLRDSAAREILVFIHGFNNQPENAAFARAEQLQRLFDGAEPGMVEVVPLIWPCMPTDGAREFVRGYYSDQLAADDSATAYARALARLQDWQLENVEAGEPCLKRINILAHSMGNRVLRGAIRLWSDELLGQGPSLLFRNLFLVAADLKNESLQRGHEGEAIPASARNVSVYYAYDDLALRASKGANAQLRNVSRRLGHTGPYDMRGVAANVYAIDCDNVAMPYDPRRGHTYFLEDSAGRPGKVFEHIFHTIRDHRPQADIRNRFEIRP